MRQNLYGSEMRRILKGSTAFVELLVATTLWGFGFIAAIWAFESFDAISVSLFRFIIAVLLGSAILAVTRNGFALLRSEFLLAIIPGVLLGLTLNLQTWGLEYTTATKSGFITTLYVVLVPIMELLFLKKHLHRLHGLWVALAVIGTALMVELHSADINIGDLMTFFCALAVSGHIVWIGEISDRIKGPFAFNVAQSFWGAVTCLPFYFLYGKPAFHGFTFHGVTGLLWLAIGSTLVGFALQVRAQRILPASFSSLVFLLESPFAMLFAVWLLSEKPSNGQITGAILIFASAALATVTEHVFREKKRVA